MGTARIRNIGIVAHIDAGKTTVSERILFYSGIEERMGEVHEGSAVLDWMDEERKRGITICSAATSVPWRDHRIHLIDTPGHVDFTVEVERCMRVLDGAILVINGVAGVQAQSETVWRQIRSHAVSALAFVNQLDRPGADFMAAVTSLGQRLDVKALPIQYPILGEQGLLGVVDLLDGSAYRFQPANQGRKKIEMPVPSELQDEVDVLRWELVEALAEEDEEVMETFLLERLPGREVLVRALAERVHARSLLPVLGGSALRNKGIQPLLDAVVELLPSPVDVPIVQARVPGAQGLRACPPDPDSRPSALAFKLQPARSGHLLFTRIYGGCIRPGDELYNPRIGRVQVVEGVFRMHAEMASELDEAGPGEIVALTGCSETTTGDTLCHQDEPLLLEPLALGEPVLTLALEPEQEAEFPRLREALRKLALEDPSFHVHQDESTGQSLISGMGELQLEVKQELLRADYGLRVRAGAPQVAYRQAPTASCSARAKVDRALGAERLVGCVELQVAPLGSGAPEEPFTAECSWEADGEIPGRFRGAISERVLQELVAGPDFGFPVGRVRVRILGGASEPERDTELGFQQAASQALREALRGSVLQVYEPQMSFEVEAPKEFMSSAIGRLKANGAQIRELSADGRFRRVRGTVALFTMFGFASVLRSLSQGRASFTMLPAGFQPLAGSKLEQRGLS